MVSPIGGLRRGSSSNTGSGLFLGAGQFCPTSFVRLPKNREIVETFSVVGITKFRNTLKLLRVDSGVKLA